MRRRLLLLVSIIAAVLAGPAAIRIAVADASAPPAGGYDDFACRPSAAHPFPLILLHGLGGDPQGNWAFAGPALASQGYCTFTSAYGPPGRYPFYGLEPIDQSAADVARLVDQVLAATGASQVSLVGHSEGAFLSLYVPKILGYGPKIHDVVALAPPTHGTSFLGLVTVARLAGLSSRADAFLRDGGCGACADLVVGGPAIQRLNDGPVAVSGVSYTVIASRTDLLVRNEAFHPATDTAFVRESGVRNIALQDACALDPVGHVGLAFDAYVLGLVERALDPTVTGPNRCSIGPPA